MTQSVSARKTRAVIVGGGGAGLIVARHMISRPEIYDFEVLERTQQIGGLWAYTDETETDQNGLPVHSSMYKNLRTNLPKEIMQAPDFPFKDPDGPSFVPHNIVHQYLLDYAEHFNLYPHIKLNTLVEHVEPEKLANGQVVWTVSYRDLRTNVQTVKTYDAVVLCNGHYTIGYVPRISGIDSFKGIAIHSHQYRVPEVYKGKTVCVLGASQSGLDISLDVCKYAEKVYLSHNQVKMIDAKLSQNTNIEQKPGIERVNENTFVFQDGSTAQIDALIYCTGYEFAYPFLSSKVELRTEDSHVEPIYKHLVHMDWPNLCIIGVIRNIIPFPTFNMQAQYCLAVIEGRISLPSPKQMREEFDKEKQSLLDKGIAIRHINKMMERQWPYNKELAELVGIPELAPVLRKILEHTYKMHRQDINTYRNYKYKITDNETFIVSYHEPC